MGGIYILIQVVLQHIIVYWAHLFVMSSAITSKIRTNLTRFLWSGVGEDTKFHLCRWEALTKPEKYDEWGILDNKVFC